QFDSVALSVPSVGNPRAELARLAARIAQADISASAEVPSDDLQAQANFVSSAVRRWYVEENYNTELGLTGSKMHAVACAAVSLVYKVGQCWYVRPDRYDDSRFSTGVASTRVFELWVRERSSPTEASS